MIIWWESLSFVEQLFATIAIASTVLLVVQVLLSVTLFGAGGDMDMDIDVDTGDLSIESTTDIGDTPPDPGVKLFTIQGIVAFFSLFGWTALLLLRSDVGLPLSTATAFVVGFLGMLSIGFAFAGILRLRSDGTLNIQNAIGKSGTVYLPIYPSREKVGKVSILIQERLVELPAVTDQSQVIPTGCQVTVLGIHNNNTLLVIKK